eukprot:763353-Hanusia_phi.AAC.1
MAKRETGAMGWCLYATAAAEEGEIVLEETPLLERKSLVASDMDEEEARHWSRIKHLVRENGVRNDDEEDFVEILYPFLHAEESVRQRALDLFHPSHVEPSKLELCRQACELMCQDAYIAGKFPWCTADIMVKFLVIFDINCHGEFLYDLSTRLAHSCEPNTFCRSEGNVLQYVTTRKVQVGEMLTFSYIGGGPIMVTSTRIRRRRLLKLGFFCYCDRCRGPDRMRSLRCPKCGESEFTPQHKILNFEEIEHKGKEGTSVKPRVETSWRCHAQGCDLELDKAGEEDLPLSQEEELEEIVFQECCTDPLEF